MLGYNGMFVSAMAELKTKETNASVRDFLNRIDDAQKKADSKLLLKMMQTVTGNKPKMWGDSIVGFGKYTYQYASGRTGDWMQTGFSPRKTNLSIYIMCGFEDFQSELKKLGKYKTGASCLYIKSLKEVNLEILTLLVKKSVEKMRKKYPQKSDSKKQ